MSALPFGVIPAGNPVITEPTTVLSDTSFLYTIPPNRPYSHIVVFLLPGVVLPPDTAAAIYMATTEEVATASSSGRTPDFKFLGAVGQGKESAVFKITAPSEPKPLDAQTQLVLGISIESSASISNRLASVPNTKTSGHSAAPTTNTVLLAQKIIRSAFNFLSGFSGSAGPGQPEVVPLKAFEEWWHKYESRLRSDPSFLDRQEE